VVTMVKKILENGSECPKCKQTTQFLKEKGFFDKIDKIVFADTRDVQGEGMKLVKQWRMKKAPFFIVENEGRTAIYTSVMELIKKELQ